MKEQGQISGNNSKNLQAGRDIVIHGLTYTETKDLIKIEAQEVFKQNSLVLANQAYELVLNRSEELLDSFLLKLEAKKPEAIESLRDPGMQYSLYTAQKEYAKTGDKNLADLLEDILVERAQNTKRDLMQIVLDECISVVPKLTPDQFDTLSLIFVIRYTMNDSVVNQEMLIQYALLHLLPFQEGIREEHSRFQHLEYSGCGTLGISSLKIEHVFRQNYMILFSKGFTIEEFEQTVSPDPKFKKYISICYQDAAKFQINIINEEHLKIEGERDGLTVEEIDRIINFFNGTTMTEHEVKTHLLKLFPPFEKFIADWDNSSIVNMTLTSVGIAIGQANITRKTKQPYDLKIWIR